MMSKVTGICFLVSFSVFLGTNFIHAESNPTDDWKGTVERRLMYLEQELIIQKNINAKIQEENENLRQKTMHLQDQVLDCASKMGEIIGNHMMGKPNSLKHILNQQDEHYLDDTHISTTFKDSKTVKRIVPSSPVDAEPVAFYSYIASDITHKLQTHQTLIYNTVRLNKGNGYHGDDGIFIVPHSGTYAFSWTLGVSRHGWATTEIVINGQKYGRAFADGDTNSEGFGTGFVIADVNEGDHVYIRTHDEGDPILYGDGLTSFSGWKL